MNVIIVDRLNGKVIRRMNVRSWAQLYEELPQSYQTDGYKILRNGVAL